MKELDLAKELIRWRDLNVHRYPCLRLLYHIPNEGKRAKWVSKAVGIVAGMPDYCLPIPVEQLRTRPGAAPEDYAGFYLELKAPGQKPTVKQSDTMMLLRQYRHFVTWTDSLQVAIDTLEWYCKGVK